MADKHIIKLTNDKAVIKAYSSSGAGSIIDISIATDLKLPSETFSLANAEVHIDEIYWTNKQNKDVTLSRFGIDLMQQGHYFLAQNGHFNFIGFRDNTYKDHDFRISFGGEGTIILVLSKVSGYALS